MKDVQCVYTLEPETFGPCSTSCQVYANITNCFLATMTNLANVNTTSTLEFATGNTNPNVTVCKRQMCSEMTEFTACAECTVSKTPRSAEGDKTVDEYNAAIPEAETMCTNLGIANVTISRLVSGSTQLAVVGPLLLAVGVVASLL